jgi:3-hydroxybutyryl-CoA dehydrogenase
MAHITGGYDKMVAKEKMTADAKAAALKLLSTTTDLAAFNACDLVIEAATENEALKIKILQQLDGMLPPEAILATNTSSISITKLAAVTKRADRFIGHSRWILRRIVGILLCPHAQNPYPSGCCRKLAD